MSNRVDLEVEDLDDELIEKVASEDVNKKPNTSKTKKSKKHEEEPEEPEKKRGWFAELMSWVIPFVIAFAVVFVLKTYIIINANIPTGSMENTIMSGENLVGYRLAYLNSDPQRGDIVIFNAPDHPSEKYIKRIIGMPGDTVTITDSHVYINGVLLEEDYLKEEWTVMCTGLEYEVPEGCYFMMGDNRNSSEDARYWTNTFVERDDILGKAIFVYWPIADFRILDN